MNGLIRGSDGCLRCCWPGDKADYLIYHDEEWGLPVADDNRLFEKICLEGFQSGLSWLTILRKRANFRAAFDGFDFKKVSGYGEADVERLLQNQGIVRHRRKIESVINNATTAYAFMQSAGIVNDHVEGCEWRFPEGKASPTPTETLRQQFQRPLPSRLKHKF